MGKAKLKEFMQHIIDTNGNPSSKVAKECNLEGLFCEICCRNVSKEHMVKVAKKYMEVNA